MATRLYGVSVGEGEVSVTEGAGSAVVADTVELTVECASTAVNAKGTTRKPTKQEVLNALDKIRNHIIAHNWPPV